jgi:hypothetical protein
MVLNQERIRPWDSFGLPIHGEGFTLTGAGCLSIIRLLFVGGIAQLGERLHGMQEVSGSIPLISTKFSVATVKIL